MRLTAELMLSCLALVLGGCGPATRPASATPSRDAGSPIETDASGAEEEAGSPSLTGLSVAPLTLVPAFSPDVHDYYVRCGAGTNSLTVTMTPAAGSTVALLQPGGLAAVGPLSVLVSVNESQAIVASAVSGSSTSEYWVRCLPYDFPRLEMTSHPAAGTASAGYYLLGDTSHATGEASYAIVLDANGVPVWYTTTSTGREPVNVESLATNVVSFVPFFDYTFNSTSAQYEAHDLAADGVFHIEPQGEPLDAHELQLLSNGDYLVLSDPILGGVDLTGLSTFGTDEYIIGCDVQEVSPGGATVWKWTATDHFDPVKDTTWPQTSVVSGITVVDPFHCNSIDVASNGDLLLSSRHMDSIFMVSKTTGAVLWKMGGATYTKEGAPYLTVADDPETSFYRQHDARLLPDGQVSVFDDQTETPGPARGVIYSYDVTARTATFAWQYQGTVSSSAMGSFRVLPDGSRLVGWGEGGEPGLAFTEVDAEGNDLVDFHFTDGDQSYRALKVPLSQLDLTRMRTSVGAAAGGLVIPSAAGTVSVGSVDAGHESDGSPEAGAGCFAVSGSGSAEQCAYSSSPASGFACATADGLAAGTCPASGLYGCCVETLSLDGGGQAISATCYYSEAAGQPASSSCALLAYQGAPYDWQTYAP